MENFAGFRKLEPSHYYFTRSLKSLESMKNVPLDFCIMVDFSGLDASQQKVLGVSANKVEVLGSTMCINLFFLVCMFPRRTSLLIVQTVCSVSVISPDHEHGATTNLIV